MNSALAKSLGFDQPWNAAPKAAYVPPGPKQDIKEAIHAGYRALGFPIFMNSQDPLVATFHQKAIVIIGDELRGAVEAVNKIDPMLQGQVLTARAAGIAHMTVAALQARLQDAAVPLASLIYRARAIVDAAMDRKPKDGPAAILWYLRVSDLRRQLQASDGDDISSTLQALAEAADETVPELLLNTVPPLMVEQFITRLVETYQKAFAGEQVALLAQATDALVEVKSVIKCAELAVWTAFNNIGQAGLQKISTPEIVKAWTTSAKASFIAAKGEEAYTSLLQGRVGLGTALGVFRPGIVEN